MGQTDPNNKLRMKLDSGDSSLHASKTPLMSSNKLNRKNYGLHDTDYDDKFKNGTTTASINSISALRTTTSTKKSNVSNFLTKS